uniref:Uncharacterized protein n=1 Tax=Timema genevievae TaxID=629358 RepID=A0A7R9JMS5_TIMGE|nr:unnamed protein product [Timema genevievae]
MGRNKKVSNLSREERMVITIAEIIQELLYAHEIGKDVNLNKMKTRISSKYGLETSPRLVDIIAALPTDHKKTLLPKLKAKPIRTASGEFFENPAFRADGLKIYPTLVIRGTGLYELWKTGRYKSYPPSTLVDLIARILALVPPWTRVYRVQRDIPMPLVSSGVEHGNLRELALARMKDLGTDCRDVRTREVGIKEIHHKVRPYEARVGTRNYYRKMGYELDGPYMSKSLV